MILAFRYEIRLEQPTCTSEQPQTVAVTKAYPGRWVTQTPVSRSNKVQICFAGKKCG